MALGRTLGFEVDDLLNSIGPEHPQPVVNISYEIECIWLEAELVITRIR